MAERIGVFGGSFNPPHVCHAMVIAYALAAHDLDRLLVIPCYEHPFSKDLARFDDRVAMCEHAFGFFGGAVEISRIEQELGGTSRTLYTLEELKRRWPTAELQLVVGSDILREIDKWYRFDAILEIASLLVIGREGYPFAPNGIAVPTLPDVSSTEIRQRVRDGLDLGRMLSPRVARYVAEHGLYRS